MADKCPECGEVWPVGPTHWDAFGAHGKAPYPRHRPGSIVCLRRQLAAKDAEIERLNRLVKTAVRTTARKATRNQVAWGLVAQRFGLGSTSATALCRQHGVDPHTGKPIEETKEAQHEA